MDKIYGNSHALECIDRAVNGGKLHHAYLLYGEKGLGKKKLAAYFAKTILCHGKIKPCGECSSCRKFDSGNHPDISWLYGDSGKNELTIANIRELKADAFIAPNDGEHKVYVLADCQKMQAPAANALLKILEEPPEHAVFLLTANSRAELLETIVSRCIQVGVYAVGEFDCTEALVQLGGADREKAKLVSASCAGNIGKGLDMLNTADTLASPEAFCESLAGGQEYMMLVSLNKLANDKKGYKEFLSAVSEELRDALVLKSGGTRSITVSQKLAKKLAAAFTVKQLMTKYRVVSKAMQNIDANANLPLLSTWIVGKLMHNDAKANL